jgi:transposase
MENPMALYIQNLDRQALKQLESMVYQREEDLPENRVRIVLLSAEGKSVPEISRAVNLHPINVRKWIHRFSKSGLEGLRSGKSPGRPRLFTGEQRQRIIAVATADPRSLGLHFSRWSLQRLRRYLMEQNIVSHISVETIRQILQTTDTLTTRQLQN